MAVWYLDSDDEITDAVARLRDTADEDVVFVVPPGSRIATGRINFKLLSREASTRGLRLAIASPDVQVRTMAASAGVLALPSAADAQAALARGDSAPEAGAAADESGTAALPSGEPTVVEQGVTRRARGRGSRRLAATVGAVAILAVVGVGVSLQTLPTADITLMPRTLALGPLRLTITATSDVAEPDLESRRVPAVRLHIPLRVDGVFTASGRERIEERASGEVVFSSPEQSFDQPIPAGTRVQTSEGVGFETSAAVVLPQVAAGAGPATVSAPIEALEPGPAGNVAPATISVVPSLASQGISVSNPRATSGGRLEERPVVTLEDYEAAAVDLQNRLAGALAAHLRDPQQATQGLTVYRETAEPGEASIEPASGQVVGSKAADFRLSGAIEASVLAVDEQLVRDLAAAAVEAEVPPGMTLLPGDPAIEASEGLAEGDRIVFESSAQGTAYQIIDRDELLSRLAGKPVSEARAILEVVGTATVSVWPDFLADLPGDPDRIRLDIQEPATAE